MRSLLVMLGLMGIAGLPAAAQVCGSNDVHGAYGLQLWGNTTIGVNGPQPMAAAGLDEYFWATHKRPKPVKLTGGRSVNC